MVRCIYMFKICIYIYMLDVCSTVMIVNWVM